MPSILGANTLSGGFEVSNSLRFNDGSSDYLSRDVGTTGNRRKWTFSAWVKRSSTGTGSIRLMSVRNGNEQEWIGFDENDIHISRYNNSYIYRYITNRKFRDPSAFYHVCVAMDSEQSTAGNRMKLYVNGVQETSFSTETQISEDYNTSWNTSSFTNYIGNNGNNGDYYDGYMSEVVLIDGLQLDPTSFGEFDSDSGIWKPISVSGLTFGTNGFYLQYKGSGTSANSSGMGADTSGNDNHFAVNNLTAVDQSTDTCTNNFATLNPLRSIGGNVGTYSEGNLHYTGANADWQGSTTTLGVNSGKWYYEAKVVAEGSKYYILGIVSDQHGPNVAVHDTGNSHGGFGLYVENQNVHARFAESDISGWDASTLGSTITTNDFINVAIDMDNKFLYFGKNGTYYKSGDPTSGATGTGAIDIGTPYDDGFFAIPAVSIYYNTPTIIGMNFGSPAYAISSGNADADGHGNFEYAVPSGYFALNTKNLAEYG